jgi:hypothetical protein
VALAPFFGEWTSSLAPYLGKDRLVLIVDETKLRDQFGVMVVGVAYAGRCIPLAWQTYRANCASAYPAEGQVSMILKLLTAIQPGIPQHRQVLVLADRGIGTSPELMRGIMALGWHFLFRVTKQSKLVLPDGKAIPFYDQVRAPNQSYWASGRVFKTRGHIPAHVRVLWAQDAQERWALVTNDDRLSGWEYAQRMWVEEAFRDLKSHGWHVEETALTCPHRLARLWIVLVVAYAWMLLWGAALAQTERTLPLKRRSDGTRVRRWSLFREGRLAFLAAGPPFPT